MVHHFEIGRDACIRSGRKGCWSRVACTWLTGLLRPRFLVRLLLVHGTLADYRLGRLIKYSFYKNITFAFIFLFFQPFNGVSGQVQPWPPLDSPALNFCTCIAARGCGHHFAADPAVLMVCGRRSGQSAKVAESLLVFLQALLDGVTAAFYNAFFTAGPICVFALFDRPVRHLGTLMDFPQMYNRRPALTTRVFWKTGILWAISHAVVGLFFWRPCALHQSSPG